MIKKINKEEFIKEFEQFRDGDDFTRKGLIALFEYFEELEDTIELDVISIISYFTQYENIDVYNECYDSNFSDWSELDNLTIIVDETSAIVYDK